MTEFTLRENADRYLLGEITLGQLYVYVDEDIIEDFRYGERDPVESALADFVLGLYIDCDVDRKLYGYFEEDEFRKGLAAHFYMEQLNSAKAKTKAKVAS